MGSKSGTTDKGSYSGGGGSSGANQSEHDKRQKKLQANVDKLKAKGATKESIAGLTAKKEKEARKFKLKTEGISEGKQLVQSQIDEDRRKYSQTGSKKIKGFLGTYDKGEMYGGRASGVTNEYLVSVGEAERGNPYYDHKGNITGYRYRLTSLGKKMKFGESGTAMGSGDPTGIMTSTAISSQMWKQQQKFKALTLATLSFAAPMPVSSLLRLGAMESYGKMGQKGYDQYLSKFYSNVAGTTSSYGIKSKGTGNGKETEVSSANITDTRTGGTTRKDNETRFKSLVASTSGSGSVAESRRTLMKRSSKTISSGTVST